MVMRWHRDEHTIDDDRQRLDMDRISAWVRGSYWASTRTPEQVDRSWAASAVVFGLYAGDEQVGCSRVVTDFVSVAYLADVFLMEEQRGRGLGRWLIETIVGHPVLSEVRWLLHTRDAHALYRQVGFGEPGPRVMERPRLNQNQ
jgi:GNAT superfamily N-acetyltransferase